MSTGTDRRAFLKLLSLLPLVPLLDERPRTHEATDLPQDPEAPNVLILVFDALSARHMSLLGYRRETTPNLARFAQRSTVFHAHYAAGNFTTPGTASIFTGVHPWSHRALHAFGKATGAYRDKNLFSLFAAQGYRTVAYTHNPLAQVLLYQFREDLSLLKATQDLCLGGQHVSEQLFANDYDTAMQSEWLLRREGQDDLAPSSLFFSLLDRARRHYLPGTMMPREYRDLFPRGVQTDFGAYGGLYFILEQAIDWIQEELRHSPQPFLGYFHLYPPHEPYNPHRRFIGLFDDEWAPEAKPPHFFSQGLSDQYLNQKRREYDEHVAYADAEFGRLYDSLAQAGLLDNTYVAVTSDHGELFERGVQGHSTQVLYEPIIRIPLLISAPGQCQRRDVYTPTSSVDLLPTLLYLISNRILGWCEGEVLPPFRGREAENRRSIFSTDARSNAKQAPLTIGTVALIRDQYKLIHYFGYEGLENEFELYDLVNDPEEMEDLYHFKRSVATSLQDELTAKLLEVNRPYTGK